MTVKVTARGRGQPGSHDVTQGSCDATQGNLHAIYTHTHTYIHMQTQLSHTHIYIHKHTHSHLDLRCEGVTSCSHSLSGGTGGTVRLSKRKDSSLDVPFTSPTMFNMSGWRGFPDNPSSYGNQRRRKVLWGVKAWTDVCACTYVHMYVLKDPLQDKFLVPYIEVPYRGSRIPYIEDSLI